MGRIVYHYTLHHDCSSRYLTVRSWCILYTFRHEHPRLIPVVLPGIGLLRDIGLFAHGLPLRVSPRGLQSILAALPGIKTDGARVPLH